jgi:hypothetical protein
VANVVILYVGQLLKVCGRHSRVYAALVNPTDVVAGVIEIRDVLCNRALDAKLLKVRRQRTYLYSS